MKTSNILILGFLIMIFLLISWFVGKASFHINTASVETSGNMVTETRDLPSFNKIKVQGKFQVNLSQGANQRLEINADENIVPEVIAEVEGGELILRLKNQIRDRDRVAVNIQLESLEALEFSAGAVVNTTGELKGNDLFVNSYAGSQGSLALQYNNLNCESKAGSHMSLSGNVDRVVIRSTAGSKIEAQNLQTRSSSIKGSAGSHVEISVSEILSADVSSGGALVYHGDPETKNLNASSGGSISKK